MNRIPFFLPPFLKGHLKNERVRDDEKRRRFFVAAWRFLGLAGADLWSGCRFGIGENP